MATRFQNLVARHGALQRRSWCSSCYDNVHAESFWSQLKTELRDGDSFAGLTKAKLGIRHHLAYYNAEHRHYAPGHHMPNHFKIHLQPTSQLFLA